MTNFFKTTIWLILIGFVSSISLVSAQKFVHPGIDQTLADLAYMKKQVQAGVHPWKDAFEQLKTETNLQFQVTPFAHVLRGPYGKPNIGGDDLRNGSNMAYNCALMDYLTDDKAYTKKVIEIINAWTPVVWDFDYNDAKLLAGWTGHILCNAAEILRYTDTGWQKKDIDRFSEMLMTVYYPDVTESGIALRDRYRNERRIKMAVEDQRFYDVRRWVIGPQAYVAAYNVEVVYQLLPDKTTAKVPTITPKVYNSYAWINKAYFLPILRTEMNKNPNLVQNPGY